MHFQKKANLTKRHVRFLDALEARVVRAGFRVLPPLLRGDRIEERYQNIRRSQGVIVPVFSQWEGHRLYRDKETAYTQASEFTHIAATMAVAAKRPLLVLREKTVQGRGAFRPGFVHPVIDLPVSLDPAWLEGDSFSGEFDRWEEQVKASCHVFLGYSTSALEVGKKIRDFLKEKLQVFVFDWHDDFHSGDIIWNSIERAERLSMCGVFLFMADDPVGQEGLYAPRDNVVYEAGYFAGAKGRAQSLIIREKDAKVPTDLGGILHLVLEDRRNIGPIERELRRHIERMVAGKAV